MENKVKLVILFFAVSISALGVLFFRKDTPVGVVEWEEYSNSDCSYQFNYPSNWIMRDTQYKNPCETRRDAKCIASQSVYIRNKKPSKLFIWKKRLFHEPPGDIGPQDQTTFSFSCSQTKYPSIEDWVKESWLSTNDDVSIEKKTLERIGELKFGVVSIPVFVAVDAKEPQTQRSGLTTCFRLHFIYKGHEYEISSESGSFEQLEKDKQILDEMLQSVKIF